MPRGAASEVGTQIGADIGATLAKLAIRRRDGGLELRSIPAADVDRVAREVASLSPERVVLTGGGGARLAERLALDGPAANQFEAWAAGARAILRREERVAPERFLLVSVGTGTSAMLVEAADVVRVGGTALGGGTLAGLAAVLVGTADFDAIARLARQGDRRRVDLLVADIYPNGACPLPGELNAASFAKLARSPDEPARDPRDLAHAIAGLVGENVALICGGLAAAAGVGRIAYGGATLRDNPAVTDILRALAPAHACEATILRDGEFTGALGALEFAGATGA
jgi:type II pantothenate kinase